METLENSNLNKVESDMECIPNENDLDGVNNRSGEIVNQLESLVGEIDRLKDGKEGAENLNAENLNAENLGAENLGAENSLSRSPERETIVEDDSDDSDDPGITKVDSDDDLTIGDDEDDNDDDTDSSENMVEDIQQIMKSLLTDKRSLKAIMDEEKYEGVPVECIESMKIVSFNHIPENSKRMERIVRRFTKNLPSHISEPYKAVTRSWHLLNTTRMYEPIEGIKDFLFENSNNPGIVSAKPSKNSFEILPCLNSHVVQKSKKEKDKNILYRMNSQFQHENQEIKIRGTLPDLPYRPDKTIQFLFTARQLSFKLGRVEPLFCRIALYDVKNQRKLSEDFTFHLNSEDMSNWMDSKLQRDQKKFILNVPKALFQITEPNEDIMMVLIIEKVLQNSLENVSKPYLAPEKFQDRGAVKLLAQEYCEDNSYFKQTLAFGFCKIFSFQNRSKQEPFFKRKSNYTELQTSETPGITITPNSPSNSPITAATTTVGQTPTISEESVPISNPPNPHQEMLEKVGGKPRSHSIVENPWKKGIARNTILKPFSGKKKGFGMLHLKTGIYQMKIYKYFVEAGQSRFDVLQLMTSLEMTKRRVKPIPGYFVFELSDASLDLLVDDEEINPVIKSSRIDPITMRRQYLHCKQLIEGSFYVCPEIPALSPSFPFVNLIDKLYIYPQALNMLGFSHPDVAHSRNLCVKVLVRSTDKMKDANDRMFFNLAGENVIETVYQSDKYQNFYLSGVTYHKKQPGFHDEIRIQLPTNVTRSHHILFVIYHMSTRKKSIPNFMDDYTGGIRKRIICYAYIPLLNDGNTFKNGIFDLPLYKKLDDNYLSSNSPQNLVDKRKKQFKVLLRLHSSIRPHHLRNFFSETHETLEYCENFNWSIVDELKNISDELNTEEEAPLTNELQERIAEENQKEITVPENETVNLAEGIKLKHDQNESLKEDQASVINEPSSNTGEDPLDTNLEQPESEQVERKEENDDLERTNDIAVTDQGDDVPQVDGGDDAQGKTEASSEDSSENVAERNLTVEEINGQKLLSRLEHLSNRLISLSSLGVSEKIAFFSSLSNALLKILKQVSSIGEALEENPLEIDAGKGSLREKIMRELSKLFYECFAIFLHMLYQIGTKKGCHDRGNIIFSRYVTYIFDESGDQAQYLSDSLLFSWVELLNCSELKLKSKYSSFFHSKNSKLAPSIKEYSLEISWFLLELIRKSMGFEMKKKQQKFEAKRLHSLQRLLNCLSDIIVKKTTNPLTNKAGKTLNQNYSLFIYDLLYMYPMASLYPAMHFYLGKCNQWIEENQSHFEDVEMLKLEFFQILSDHEMILQLVYPKKGIKSNFFINSLCTNTLRFILTMDHTPKVSQLYLDMLYSLLTKFDAHKAYQDSKSRNHLCRLFFHSFVKRLVLLSYYQHKDEEPEIDQHHVVCFHVELLRQLSFEQKKILSHILLFILKNTSMKETKSWIVNMSFGQLHYVFRYFTLMLDITKEKNTIDFGDYEPPVEVKKSPEKLEEQKRNCYFCLELFRLCNQFITWVFPRIEKESSSEACAYLLDSWVDFMLHYLDQNEYNVDVLKMFLDDTFLPFLEKIGPILSQSDDSNDIRWQKLLGILLEKAEFPLRKNTSKMIRSCIEKLCSLKDKEFAKLHSKELKYFCEEEDSELNILRSEDDPSDIRGATLNKLIENLVYPFVKLEDTALKEVFFLTFRSFTTPFDLVCILISLYKLSAKKENPEDAIVILNIIVLFTHWLEHHFYDFHNSLIIKLVQFLDSEDLNDTQHLINSKLKVHLTKLLLRKPVKPEVEKMEQVKVKKERTLLPPKFAQLSAEERTRLLDEIQTFTSWTQFDIFQWNTKEIARQLTLIDYDIYSKIQPKECLKNAWMKKNGSAPNIEKFTKRFNSLSLWVTNAILSESSWEKRREVTKKFLEVSYHAHKLRNYNCVNALLSGLRDSSIYRLDDIWQYLSPRESKLFEEIAVVMAHQDRYKAMREIIKSQNKSAIPFIGGYLTDLTFIEDGNQDWIKVGLDKSIKLINMTKRKLQSRIIKEMLAQQKYPYLKIRKIEYLYDSLLKICEMDDMMERDECYELSLEICPRISMLPRPRTPEKKEEKSEPITVDSKEQSIPLENKGTPPTQIDEEVSTDETKEIPSQSNEETIPLENEETPPTQVDEEVSTDETKEIPSQSNEETIPTQDEDEQKVTSDANETVPTQDEDKQTVDKVSTEEGENEETKPSDQDLVLTNSDVTENPTQVEDTQNGDVKEETTEETKEVSDVSTLDDHKPGLDEEVSTDETKEIPSQSNEETIPTQDEDEQNVTSDVNETVPTQDEDEQTVDVKELSTEEVENVALNNQKGSSLESHIPENSLKEQLEETGMETASDQARTSNNPETVHEKNNEN